MILAVLNIYADINKFLRNNPSPDEAIVVTTSDIVGRALKAKGFRAEVLRYNRSFYGVVADVLLMIKFLLFIFFHRARLSRVDIYSEIANEHFLFSGRVFRRIPIRIIKTVAFNQQSIRVSGSLKNRLRGKLYFGAVDWVEYNGSLISQPSVRLLSQKNIKILSSTQSLGGRVHHINPSSFVGMVFFLQPIVRTGKVAQAEYVRVINELKQFAAKQNLKFFVKLHPRMTHIDIAKLVVDREEIWDMNVAGEDLPHNLLFISISSQVIWRGAFDNRVSIIDCIKFLEPEVREALKHHMLENSDAGLRLARSISDVLP